MNYYATIKVVDVRTGKKFVLDSSKTLLKAERSEQGIRLSGTTVIEDYKTSIGFKKVEWDCHVDLFDLPAVKSWAVDSDCKSQELEKAEAAYEFVYYEIGRKWREVKDQAFERLLEIDRMFEEVKKEAA